MDPVALAGLVVLLTVKEAGLPIPVPGDLLVVVAGVAAHGPGVPPAVALAAILAAGYVGGSVQFLLVRGTLRRTILAILVRIGVGHERLEALSGWLARRGSRGVAVARATPAVRVGAIAASGLAGLPFAVFLVGLVVGNGLFVGAHYALGFVLGPPAEQLAAQFGAVGLGVVAFVVFAGLGAAGWRRLRRTRGGYGGWVEAACPACLALAAVRPDVAR